MRDRQFRLYSKGNGPYEVVPIGWSMPPALLGPFWAVANGLTDRYVLLGLPLVPLAALANELSSLFGYLALAYVVAAYLVYFPLKAGAWRERVLLSKGYVLRAIVGGASAKDALRKYAESGQLYGA